MPPVQDYLTLTDIFFSNFKKWAQKNPEAVLVPFIGTQAVTPWLRGSGEIRSLYFWVMPGTE